MQRNNAFYDIHAFFFSFCGSWTLLQTNLKRKLLEMCFFPYLTQWKSLTFMEIRKQYLFGQFNPEMAT